MYSVQAYLEVALNFTFTLLLNKNKSFNKLFSKYDVNLKLNLQNTKNATRKSKYSRKSEIEKKTENKS